MPRRGGEAPICSLPTRTHQTWWDGTRSLLAGSLDASAGPRAKLFRITSCLGFSLIYLSLSLDEPCGFCLQDEGKWEEGEKAKRQPPHVGQTGNHSVSQWPGPSLRITRHLPS